MSMNIYNITFSPTGGTQRVGDRLCQSLGANCVATDLCVSEGCLIAPCIGADDLAVISMPVYAGRVPAVAVHRLREIKSHGARCVIVAVYGNRAYDDALVEMLDVATELGYRVIAAIGAVAEHSIVRKYGAGRPDADDARDLALFAEAIARKLASGSDSVPEVPGNRPYKTPKACPQPSAHGSCKECGLCAKQCPVGAISVDNPKRVDKDKCISCIRCVKVCPTHSRGIGKIVAAMVTQLLKKGCAMRKPNELFI